MAKIDIDVETIRSSASTLEAKVNELKVLRFELQKLISQIDSTWDGPASRSYINRMNNYLTKINDIIKILSNYFDYLKNTADDIEKLDLIWRTITKTIYDSVLALGGINPSELKM